MKQNAKFPTDLKKRVDLLLFRPLLRREWLPLEAELVELEDLAKADGWLHPSELTKLREEGQQRYSSVQWSE